MIFGFSAIGVWWYHLQKWGERNVGKAERVDIVALTA